MASDLDKFETLFCGKWKHDRDDNFKESLKHIGKFGLFISIFSRNCYNFFVCQIKINIPYVNHKIKLKF